MIGCSFFLHIAQCTNFYWFYIELKSFLEEYSFSFNLPTGKWFSQALIFASTNPQYDKILFFESPVQYMKIPSSEHVVYTNCFLFLFWYSEQFMYTTCSELGIVMYWTGDSKNNLLPYCGLVDAKIRASDNHLPVQYRNVLRNVSEMITSQICLL